MAIVRSDYKIDVIPPQQDRHVFEWMLHQMLTREAQLHRNQNG